MDDIRENIINYEDEGGGEVDTGFDLDVLRQGNYFEDTPTKQKESLYGRGKMTCLFLQRGYVNAR